MTHIKCNSYKIYHLSVLIVPEYLYFRKTTTIFYDLIYFKSRIWNLVWDVIQKLLRTIKNKDELKQL